MGVGLEIRNDAYALQLDGETPLLGLAAHGITTNTIVSVGGLTAPIMALAGTAWIADVTNTGSTYTWSIASNGDPFEYFVFDDSAGIPSANGFGMEVFDDNGRLIYSSSVKPMQIIGRVQLPANDFNLGVLSSNGSRRLAYIPSSMPPLMQDHYFTTSAFSFGWYDENVTETGYAPSTPRSDQPISGNIEAAMIGSNTFYYPEAGVGEPPASYRSWSGEWNCWIIDVTSIV